MSVVTIGSFTTSRLTAQPFGYEGEARFGRTARTFRISGLLTPTEWQTLVSEYNAWRSTRIQDPDTLVSKTVGTTITFSTGVSINNLSVTNLACWFAEAPQGEQAGRYVSATVVMVDAAQALAVLLAEQDAQNEETVDCAVITARLQRQKNETDCELAALADGLADDFAGQRVTRQILEKTADLGALAGSAETIAGLDLQLETLQAQSRLAAYQSGDLASLRGALLDIEVVENEADITAIGSRVQALKDSRTLKALWDKYLSDGTVPHGTVSYGGVSINLTAPPETRSNGPNVQFTATGNTLVSGAAKSMLTKQVVGYTNAAGASGLLSWYDSTVAAPVSAGQWFPTQAPQFTTEYVLVDGVKSTRYNVTMTVVQLT